MKRPGRLGVICGVLALAVALVGLSLATGVDTVNAQDKPDPSGPSEPEKVGQGVVNVKLGL